MKNIMIDELNEFLLSDYVYLPYINKEELSLRSDRQIFKGSSISSNKDNNKYSPVSGVIYGLSEISSLEGLKKVLIIENDFRDKEEIKRISNKDIYKINKDAAKNILKIDNDIIALRIYKSSSEDKRDAFILKDNVKNILETLNLIDILYPNVKVKIVMDKKDLTSYQTLFSYIGTYPNIDIEFNTKKQYKYYSLYEIIDMYNSLKNSTIRDYIYFTMIYEKKSFVIKCKMYTNLSEVLNYLEILPKKIIVNGKTVLQSPHFLLEENIFLINIS